MKINQPICEEQTADPWMIEHNGMFYLTCTLEYRIEIWASVKMDDFSDCRRVIIWEPVPTDEFIFNLWAPELHRFNSTWYIYFTAAHPERRDSSSRTLMLKSADADLMNASSWTYLGRIKNMPDHRQLDTTVFQHQSKLFCCYSGWLPGDTSDMEQILYLIKLKSPEEALPETLLCISSPVLDWERFADDSRGINTAPTFLNKPFFTGLVYGASCSWTDERKLALLYLDGDDPLELSSWSKRKTPLLVSDANPPYGPGQASFIGSSESEDMIYCIYHAQPGPGRWHNRQARIVPLVATDFARDAGSVYCSDLRSI